MAILADAVAEAALEPGIPASLVQIIRQHGASDVGLCRVLIMALDSLLEGCKIFHCSGLHAQLHSVLTRFSATPNNA